MMLSNNEDSSIVVYETRSHLKLVPCPWSCGVVKLTFSCAHSRILKVKRETFFSAKTLLETLCDVGYVKLFKGTVDKGVVHVI